MSSCPTVADCIIYPWKEVALLTRSKRFTDAQVSSHAFARKAVQLTRISQTNCWENSSFGAEFSSLHKPQSRRCRWYDFFLEWGKTWESHDRHRVANFANPDAKQSGDPNGDSNPLLAFREVAQFGHKPSQGCMITAEHATSRCARIAQNYAVPVSEFVRKFTGAVQTEHRAPSKRSQRSPPGSRSSRSAERKWRKPTVQRYFYLLTLGPLRTRLRWLSPLAAIAEESRCSGLPTQRLSPIRFNDSLQSLFEEGDGLAIGVCRDFWIGPGQAVLSAGDAQ